jgi:hypothetical protein
MNGYIFKRAVDCKNLVLCGHNKCYDFLYPGIILLLLLYKHTVEQFKSWRHPCISIPYNIFVWTYCIPKHNMHCNFPCKNWFFFNTGYTKFIKFLNSVRSYQCIKHFWKSLIGKKGGIWREKKFVCIIFGQIW